MRIVVHHLPDGLERTVEWPIGGAASIGSAPGQLVCLDGPGIAPEHAVITRVGHHTVLRAGPGAQVSCEGLALAPDGAQIIDGRTFVIGDYAVRVTDELGTAAMNHDSVRWAGIATDELERRDRELDGALSVAAAQGADDLPEDVAELRQLRDELRRRRTGPSPGS